MDGGYCEILKLRSAASSPKYLVNEAKIKKLKNLRKFFCG